MRGIVTVRNRIRVSTATDRWRTTGTTTATDRDVLVYFDIEGIRVANKDAFFDFTEGRILTLDY